MEIKYNDTFSTSHSSDDVFDFIEKDTTLLDGPRNEVTLFPTPTEVSLNETLYSGYEPQNIQLDEPESSLIKGSSIEIKPILLSDPDVNAQAAFAKSHTRDFYKGRSFRYAGKWEEGVHYINDEYITDFVVKDQVLLVCKKSNMSSWKNNPSEWIYEGDRIVAVVSDYWEVVLAGGIRGKTYLPEYDSLSDSLIWRLVDPEQLPQEFQTYLGIREYVDYALVPIQEKLDDIESDVDITKRELGSLENDIINLDNSLTNLEIVTGRISTHVEDLESNFSEFVQTAEGFFYKVGDLENNVGQLWLTSQQFGVQLENAEGDISNLIIQADQISTRVENAEGDISQINQRADEIQSEVENQQGDISRITQRADMIESQVQNLEGDVSTISQRADEIQSQVESVEGDISTISQRADIIELQVESQVGDISRISQTVDDINLRVENAEGNIASLDVRADQITSTVSDQQDQISQIRQTSTEIASEVAANKVDADNKYTETNSRITQTAAAINLEVARVEGKVDTTKEVSKSNIQILADAIIQQTIDYQYDEYGRLTNETKSAITTGMNDISLDITGSKLETVGIFIRNANVNDNYINLIADKVRIKGTGDHTPTALGIYWDSTSQSYKISAANLQVEGAFSTTAWTDATTGQRKLVLDDAAAAATGPTGYLTEALYGQGGSALSPTGGVYGTINPMTVALSNFTTITGGLILTTELILGQQSGQSWLPWAGMSGAYDARSQSQGGALGHGIAAWYGGDSVDKASLTPSQIEEGWSNYRWARTLFRMDGSGYLADRKLYWSDQGDLHILGNVTIDGDNYSQTLNEIYNHVITLSSWFAEDTETIPGKTLLRINMGSQQGTGFDGLIFDGFLLSGGDQIVGSGTPGGGGGGGGASYLSELWDVQRNLSPAVDDLLVYSSSVALNPDGTYGSGWKNISKGLFMSTYLQLGDAAHLGVATSIGSGMTGLTSGALIREVLGDNFNAGWSVKDFINSSISTATAEYRGSYNEKTDLNLNPTATRAEVAAALATKMAALSIVPDDNDYCFVEIPTSASTPTEIARTERYKYDGTNWAYEYTLNNSGFTAAQWAAINSGITDSKVGTYDSGMTTLGTIAGYFSNGVLGTSHLPSLYIGDAQVQTSAQTAQNVGGLGNVTMGFNKTLNMQDDAASPNSINALQFYKTTGSSTTYILRLGGGMTAADRRTMINGGAEVRIQTGRSSSTTHISFQENGDGVKSTRLYSYLALPNAAPLYMYDNPTDGTTSSAREVLYLSNTNYLRLGYATATKGYATRIHGSLINFYTAAAGGTQAVRMQITAAGNIETYGDIRPHTSDTYDLGSESAFFAEAYAKKIYLASGIYLEYVPASGDTPGYVHLNTNFKTDGDQIIGAADPGGGGGGGSEYLWELEDVDDALITPNNGVVLQYNATAGKWVGVTSDTIGITTAGTIEELNAVSPSTDKRVWSPSVLASWLAGKNYVENVTIGTEANAEKLAVTRGGATSYLTVPYATNVARFKRYEGTAEAGGYDLNTLLSGGGITSQYNSVYYWANAPANMSYGGAVQMSAHTDDSLAMQLAWDVVHNGTQGIYQTGKLWWRDATYHDGAADWGAWHLIYDDTTLTKSVITGLLDTGNGTYVKLNPGNVEQTISSNISLLDKGVVNLWRKSGDHYTFLGFSNGTTETFLGGLGFKSQSDNNLYHWIKSGASSSYSIIYDAGNCNKSDVNWACNGLTANDAIIGSYTATNAIIQLRNTYGTFKVQAPSSLAAVQIGYGDGPLFVNAAGNVSIESGQGLSLKIKRTTSGAGAYMAFYPGNQDTNYWDIGSSADNVFRFEYMGALLDSISTTGAMTIRSSVYDGLSIKRTATGSAGLRFFPDNQDTHSWDIGSYGNNDNYMFRFTYDGSDKAYFLTDGTLRTAGDQVITSDIRMKKNLKPIDLKVEDIAKCRAVTFDWTTGGHSFGSVAQDWEPILPEAVKDGKVKTLAYGQAALVAAINLAKHDTEQDDEIRRLKEREAEQDKEIRQLRKRVKNLEDEVKQLKVN